VLRRRPAVTALVVCAIAGAGCGGDDKADAEQVVKDFAQAATERDGEKLCNELVTQEFVEQVTLAKGDEAREDCAKVIEESKAQGFAIKQIERTVVDGNQAKVTTQIERGGQQYEYVFQLEKEDGDFRLTTSPG
jgi:hypothetical protein